MKKLLLFLFSCTYLFSQEFITNELKLTESKKIINKTETIIVTSENLEIKTVSTKDLTTEQLTLVERTYNTFFKWNELKIASALITFDNLKLSIILNIDTLIINGEDVSPFMPSGIQVYYDKFFEYDFRMFKDYFFMRLKGQFYNKSDLLDEIYNAYKDPVLYVQIHDPSYLIRQIDQLRSENLKQDDEMHTMVQKFEDLLDKYNNLEERYLDTVKDTINIKNGILSLNNKSFFGALNSFDLISINKVIEFKKENIDLSVKELELLLKSSGLKVSSKLIESVFVIYFNEYP